MHIQMLSEKLLFWDGKLLVGRLSLDKMSVFGDGMSVNLSNKSFVVSLLFESIEEQQMWLNNVKKQVQTVDNQRIKIKTSPKEEIVSLSLKERVEMFSSVDIADNPSLRWSAHISDSSFIQSTNNEDEDDFMGDKRDKQTISNKQQKSHFPSPSPTAAGQVSVSLPPQIVSSTSSVNSQPQKSKTDPRRSLINPKFILTVLKVNY